MLGINLDVPPRLETRRPRLNNINQDRVFRMRGEPRPHGRHLDRVALTRKETGNRVPVGAG
ncbi:hypothetical protein MASR1M101_34430 [Gemmatimonas sp.]